MELPNNSYSEKLCMVFHNLFIVIDTHAMATSVVLIIVVLTSDVFPYVLLLRHHETASFNGSGNGFGAKLGDGIVTKVLP